MNQVIKKKKPVYSFSKEHEPVCQVKAGERLTIETYDCFEDQITSDETKMSHIDWNRINPATGPLYVQDAQPGDILAVTIHQIDIHDHGILATGPNLGAMGDRLKELTFKRLRIQNGKALFNENLPIPLHKMIGVMGVAPEGEAVPCGTPGNHGGNLDTKLITEGATIYFPVFHEGALFGLGDMHAAMGDGEVGGSGVEVGGKADLTIDVIKDKHIQHPVVVNQEGVSVLVSADTLDEATKTAVATMADLLLPHLDMDLSELTMLMSAIGQVQVSQVVNPIVTARFSMPKWILDQYHIKLF